MAKLEEVLPSSIYKVNPRNSVTPTPSSSLNTGKKRRAWLEEAVPKETSENIEKKGVYRPYNFTFEDLRSNPLLLAKYFFELVKHSENRETERLTLTKIQSALGLSRDSARTALRFLLKNGLVERIAFKSGIKGWSKYRISESMFQDISNAIVKGSISPFSFIEKSVSCDSASETFSWNDVDIEPLENIGLSQKHLYQLKGKILPEVVQESINHYAYAVKYNKKVQAYKDKLNVFMGVLIKGKPWFESEYKSPKELAQEAFLNEKKKEADRLKKLYDEAYKIAFEDWKAELSKKEKEHLIFEKGNIPTIIKMPEGAKNAQLSTYFKENIWPDRKKRYIKD